MWTNTELKTAKTSLGTRLPLAFLDSTNRNSSPNGKKNTHPSKSQTKYSLSTIKTGFSVKRKKQL